MKKEVTHDLISVKVAPTVLNVFLQIFVVCNNILLKNLLNYSEFYLILEQIMLNNHRSVLSLCQGMRQHVIGYVYCLYVELSPEMVL